MLKHITNPLTPSKKAKVGVYKGGVVITTEDGRQICLSPAVIRLIAPRLPEAATIAELSHKATLSASQAWKAEISQ